MKTNNQPKRRPCRRHWQRPEIRKTDPTEIMKQLEKAVEEGSPFDFALKAMKTEAKNGSMDKAVIVEKDKEEPQNKKVKKE